MNNIDTNLQNGLEPGQLSNFYHDDFIVEQINGFDRLVKKNNRLQGRLLDGVIDVGGGVGHFAKALQDNLGLTEIAVIDTDPVSVAKCLAKGINAEIADALNYEPTEKNKLGVFNLILHHLISNTEKQTRANQVGALRRWSHKQKHLFVTEYIYDSWILNLSGIVIYMITRSKLLSLFVQIISRLLPSFHANTLGAGVRFRSKKEWVDLFDEAGFTVQDSLIVGKDNLDFVHHVLFIKKLYRMSFILAPKQ